MLPQATSSYLYLLLHAQFLLHKTEQNQNFEQHQQILVTCLSMSILQNHSQLKTPPYLSLPANLSPANIHWHFTLLVVFSIVCVCEKGGKGGRERITKCRQNIGVFCLLRKATINVKKGKSTTSVFHKLSRTLTPSYSMVVESQNVFYNQPRVSEEYGPLTDLHEFNYIFLSLCKLSKGKT